MRWQFGQFSRDNFRPEVVSGVMSDVVVDQTGANVRVIFDDSRLNRA